MASKVQYMTYVHGLQLCGFIHFVLQNSFQFGGVHCGALATIKFKLSNMVRVLLYREIPKISPSMYKPLQI